MDSQKNPFDFIKCNKEFVLQLETNRNAIEQRNAANYEHKGRCQDRLYFNNEKSEKYGLIKRLQNPRLGDEVRLHSAKPKRANEVFREKKESFKEFVIKKRRIFTANMNIKIREEETVKLEECMRTEQESLNTRLQDIHRDKEFITNFIHEFEVKTQQAQEKTEQEALRKETLQTKINKILARIEKHKNKMENLNGQIAKLKDYRSFIEHLWGKSISQNKAACDLFLTADPQEPIHNNYLEEEEEELVIPFQDPQQVPEFLDQLEKNNINHIVNTAEMQDLLDKIIKEHADQLAKLEKLTVSNKLKRQQQTQLKEEKEKRLNKLAMFQIQDSRQIELQEGTTLNMQTIFVKIKEIYLEIQQLRESKNFSQEVFPQVRNKENITTGEVISMLRDLEEQMNRLTIKKKQLHQSEDYHKTKFVDEKEKAIKKEINLKKKREKDQLEQRNLWREQQRVQNLIKKQRKRGVRKGRKDMLKTLLDKQDEAKHQEKSASESDDEKYFRESD